MRVLSSLMATLAAFVVALLVVPAGTAGAAPATGMQVGTGQISMTQDGASVLATLASGTFRSAGDILEVVDKSGRVVDRVPLALQVGDAAVRVAPVLAADRTSVQLTPTLVEKPKKKADPKPQGKNAKPNDKKKPNSNKKKPKRMTKGQAWDAMWKQLKADWPCASGYIGGGALLGAVIGAVLGVVIFSLVFAAYGAYIGAYIGTIVGYSTCNKGAGRKAYEKWMATP